MSTLGPPGSVLGAAGATLGNLMGPEPPPPWAAFEGSSSSSGVDDGRAGLSGVDDGRGLVSAFWEGS